ncbi:MAG: antibiotic biosynthesis monooxygenase [Sneathiella sp.]
MTADEALTLINSFEVPAGKLEEAILHWEQGRDVLQKQHGYISTALHQSLTEEARFRLVNVAKWESVETFTAAIKIMQADPSISKVEGLTPNPALYTVIRN